MQPSISTQGTQGGSFGTVPQLKLQFFRNFYLTLIVQVTNGVAYGEIVALGAKYGK